MQDLTVITNITDQLEQRIKQLEIQFEDQRSFNTLFKEHIQTNDEQLEQFKS